MPQALLDYLAPKKILLLGFGREGRSTYQYIRRHFPEKELSIADQNPVTLRGCDTSPCIAGSLSGGDKPL